MCPLFCMIPLWVEGVFRHLFVELTPPHSSASAWLLQIVIVCCPCSSDHCSPPASLFSSLLLNLGIFLLLCVVLILPCFGRSPLPCAAFSEVAFPFAKWMTNGGPFPVCHFGGAWCPWWRAATALAMPWLGLQPAWAGGLNLFGFFSPPSVTYLSSRHEEKWRQHCPEAETRVHSETGCASRL